MTHLGFSPMSPISSKSVTDGVTVNLDRDLLLVMVETTLPFIETFCSTVPDEVVSTV